MTTNPTLRSRAIEDMLANRKQVNDLMTSTLTQRALEAYVTVGRYATHVRRSCQAYRRRHNEMLAAIDRSVSAKSVQVSHPQGGLFIWMRLPGAVSAVALLPCTAREGVEYAPSPCFFAAKPGRAHDATQFRNPNAGSD